MICCVLLGYGPSRLSSGDGENEGSRTNAHPSADTRSYLPPVPIGGVMRGTVIAKVVATKSSKFSVGEYVIANSGWAEMAIVKEKELQKLEVPANGKVTDGLGVLGRCCGLTRRSCCSKRG